MRAASTNSRAGRLVEDGPRRADRSAKFISVSGAHLYGGAGKRKMDRPGNYLSTTGGDRLMRWQYLFRRRSLPSPAPDLTAVAEAAYAHGATSATECERTRCATILQNPVADLNRASAELLAFGTDMDPPTALRLLTELANLGEAQQRTGPAAEHYARAARTITERKSNP